MLIDLEYHGHECNWWSDIEDQKYPDTVAKDALEITSQDLFLSDMIISNPPWSRNVLHSIVQHLAELKPTWLLFDSDWWQTQQSSEIFEEYCTDMVAVGRLIWIPDTKMSGKDNCTWYRFYKDKNGPTKAHGR